LWAEPIPEHSKPCALQSPERWPRAFVCLAVVPSQGGRAQLRGRLIVRSGCHWLWWRSCRRWHLGPGVEWDVPLGPGHLRLGRERSRGRGVGPHPGRRRPKHLRSVEKWWSRGRFSIAILADAQGVLLPSVDPLKPCTAQMDPAARVRDVYKLPALGTTD